MKKEKKATSDSGDITKEHHNKFLTKAKSIVWFFGKIIIAGGIIYWLVSDHYDEFIHVIKNVDYNWLILALIFYIISQVAAAFSWYLLLRVQKIKVSFFEALSLSMQGTFFSLVIPGGALGGDVVRTSFLLSRTPKGTKLAATSTVFMDRFTGMFGQFSIALIMAFFCIYDIKSMDRVAQFTVLLILAISLLGIIIGIMFLIHRKLERFRLYSFLTKIGDKWTKGFVTEATNILDVYNRSKKTMVNCVLIGAIFIQLNMSLILYFVAKGIHAANISIKPLIFSIAVGNTAGLLPITPSGLGTRDAVVKTVLSNGGFSIGDSIAMPLLFSSIMLFVGLLGGLFLIFHKKKKEMYDIGDVSDESK